MDARFVFEVLINFSIVRRDLEDAQLAALVDGKISLVLFLLTAPTFPLAVGLVHGDEIFSEEAALAPTGGLSDLKGHISRID